MGNHKKQKNFRMDPATIEALEFLTDRWNNDQTLPMEWTQTEVLCVALKMVASNEGWRWSQMPTLEEIRNRDSSLKKV